MSLFSIEYFSGDGSTRIYAVNIPYISRSHMTFLVDSVEASFNWLNDTQIEFTTAPAIGTNNIKVQRITPKTPLTDFSNGSTLDEADLDRSLLQTLYLAQETEDAGTDAKTSATAAANSALAAQTSATEAAEAVGGVRVSSNDTVPSNLEDKLVAGTGISMTTSDDGSNETRVVSVDVGTGSNQVVQLDGSSSLPPVDGSKLTGISTGASSDELARIKWLENNLALNTVNDIVDEGRNVLEMVDGFADEFNDETGIDTASSTSQTYNEEGSFYSSVSHGMIDQSDGTNIGNLTGSGGLSAVFDGNASTFGQRSSANGQVGKTYSVSKTVSKVDFTIRDSTKIDGGAGSETITVEVRGSTDGFSSSNVLIETFTGLINDTNGQSFSLTLTEPAPYTSFRLDFSHTGGAETDIAEVVLYEKTVGNMTLVSEGVIANDPPDTSRLMLIAKPVDTVSLNTDLMLDVSRDDGTTWETSILAEEAEYNSSGVKVYVANGVNLSGQPSDTNMRVRARTDNSKEIEVHAWVSQWR